MLGVNADNLRVGLYTHIASRRRRSEDEGAPFLLEVKADPVMAAGNCVIFDFADEDVFEATAVKWTAGSRVPHEPVLTQSVLELCSRRARQT